MKWHIGEVYKITLLNLFEYEGLIYDQDDTWVFMNCADVGRKSFRKSQITGEQH